MHISCARGGDLLYVHRSAVEVRGTQGFGIRLQGVIRNARTRHTRTILRKCACVRVAREKGFRATIMRAHTLAARVQVGAKVGTRLALARKVRA